MHLLCNHPGPRHMILIFLSLSWAGHPGWEVQLILELKSNSETFASTFQILLILLIRRTRDDLHIHSLKQTYPGRERADVEL